MWPFSAIFSLLMDDSFICDRAVEQLSESLDLGMLAGERGMLSTMDMGLVLSCMILCSSRLLVVR
jgi:hypothetical protein